MILTRKRPPHKTSGCPAMRVSPYVYNTAAQLASEIGTSMVKVLDILVDYAVDHIIWEEVIPHDRPLHPDRRDRPARPGHGRVSPGHPLYIKETPEAIKSQDDMIEDFGRLMAAQMRKAHRRRRSARGGGEEQGERAGK